VRPDSALGSGWACWGQLNEVVGSGGADLACPLCLGGAGAPWDLSEGHRGDPVEAAVAEFAGVVTKRVQRPFALGVVESSKS
jgi:hypothetical protein